jgi:hypothetical protein
MLRVWFIGMLAWLLAVVPAMGGQIAILEGTVPMIGIDGSIAAGDERIFQAMAQQVPAALVVLSGPGGSLGAAMAIGQEIRSRGWKTLVPARARCASACAVIWLAGTTRFLGPDARIGFHAISASHGGGAAAETHAFDGDLVDYLTRLGYALDVTATIVNTPSVLVRWLDLLELNANGIASRGYP